VITAVSDAHPPATVVAALNPIVRTLLRTPAGRFLGDLALIEFTGRNSGRRYKVPVGWHEVDGIAVVFTPAPWRANFMAGAEATVHHRGSSQQMIGTLVTDPGIVAASLQQVLDGGTPPRLVGLKVPTGHALSEGDIAGVHRAMIQFVPAAISAS